MATRWSQKANPMWGSRYAPISKVAPAIANIGIPVLNRDWSATGYQTQNMPQDVFGQPLTDRESKIMANELGSLGKDLAATGIGSALALGIAAPNALTLGNVLDYTAAVSNFPAKVGSTLGSITSGLMGFDPGSVTFGSPIASGITGLATMANPMLGILSGFVAPAAVDLGADALDARKDEETRDNIEDALGAIAGRRAYADINNAVQNAVAATAQQPFSSYIDNTFTNVFKTRDDLITRAIETQAYNPDLTKEDMLNTLPIYQEYVPKTNNTQPAESRVGAITGTDYSTGGWAGISSNVGVHSFAGEDPAYSNGGHATSTDGSISGYSNSGYGPGMGPDSPGGVGGFGNFGGSESNAGDGGGNGTGAGTGRVICTKLVEYGLLDKELHEAEAKWVDEHKSVTTIRGYHQIAVPFVNKWDVEASKLTKPLVWLATKFATYASGKGSIIGWLIDKIGTAVCWTIGRFVKYDKFDKKYDRLDSDRIQKGN